MQRLQDFQPDAVLGISVPMHSDSCGCVLSHHLGVPFIDVSGHPIVDAPPSIPQVCIVVRMRELVGLYICSADLNCASDSNLCWLLAICNHPPDRMRGLEVGMYRCVCVCVRMWLKY